MGSVGPRSAADDPNDSPAEAEGTGSGLSAVVACKPGGSETPDARSHFEEALEIPFVEPPDLQFQLIAERRLAETFNQPPPPE